MVNMSWYYIFSVQYFYLSVVSQESSVNNCCKKIYLSNIAGKKKFPSKQLLRAYFRKDYGRKNKESEGVTGSNCT